VTEHNPRETPDLAPAPDGQALIGCQKAVIHDQVAGMSPAAQDSLIRDVLETAQNDLRTYVGGAVPQGPLVAYVTGPHDDLLLGPFHQHVVAGYFILADLPRDCGAYATYVTGETPDDGNGQIIQGSGA
jgi:hypothetical protein